MTDTDLSDTPETAAPEIPTRSAADLAKNGRFLDALVRTNRQIKSDRATSIAEDTQLVYKRRVEDLVTKVRKLKRELINSLDLSGDSALSLKVAANFDENKWLQDDVTRRMDIRNLMIQLAVVYQGYEELFGPNPALLDGLDITTVGRVPAFD